ncbi:hypothetical protein CHLRE_07g334700v5 [Chlamydomonas reinhardtii]|uniref:Autophagy-related protein 101 n=1 Tax=Chlamydomonas reinhardtii TaxID=3055 RepID=A8JCL2_CHLRE|nr:uncharacterized protein CHLRE_07g334700v5 [Chlamydomonas reinhardtii]PNW80906.1 hypothetical protein CHLRE_07g334700v5 [Chlamydomonas reinhardtii]|eukprot:XP_001700159.1 predicted protein [Chlamydomonas reinhardtii]
MANCETYNLPVLELEPHQIREALRCVLHTIIFNRALGYVVPKDVDSELFDITFVKCGDPAVEARVESRISDFCAQVDKRPADLHQLQLSFYETRRKQAWFGMQDERLYWETWVLSVLVLQPDVAMQTGSGGAATTSAAGAAAGGSAAWNAGLQQQSQHAAGAVAASSVPGVAGAQGARASSRQARMQAALEEQLAFVVRCVNDRRDHIPPVLSASAVTFPFDITFSGSSARSSASASLQGSLQAVGKMLLKATPPPVLS